MWRHSAHMGGHIGTTWWIRFNHRPSAAAMRSYVKLLWPLVVLAQASFLPWLQVGLVSIKQNVFLKARCQSCHPNNSVKGLKETQKYWLHPGKFSNWPEGGLLHCSCRLFDAIHRVMSMIECLYNQVILFCCVMCTLFQRLSQNFHTVQSGPKGFRHKSTTDGWLLREIIVYVASFWESSLFCLKCYCDHCLSISS